MGKGVMKMRFHGSHRPELPVVDARNDARIFVAMDRVIHIGSGTGTFGVERTSSRRQREGARDRRPKGPVVGVWAEARRWAGNMLIAMGHKLANSDVS